MNYTVIVNKKAKKNIEKMPDTIKRKMVLLVDDLIEKGPILKEWSKFSKLNESEYHCHLSYHWVACWRHEKNSILIEVYYAGSRENAPY
jgi:mRNA-degrading endonuclease RelE of RelBE toxin-antitoxin system